MENINYNDALSERTHIIDYDKILRIIKDEFATIMENNYEFYKDYRVAIDIEQQYIKYKKLEPNVIYIVLNFMPTSILFGQSSVPCTITVMAEENKIDTSLRLLTEFAESFNLVRVDGGKIQQIFQLPSVNRNFDSAASGFRAIMRVSATFVITSNANFYEVDTYNEVTGEWNPVDFVSTGFSFNNNLDTQVFYGNKNFPNSISKFGSLQLTMSTYLFSDNGILDKIIDISTKNFNETDPGTDTTFRLRLRFTNGKVLEDNFKLVHFATVNRVGEIPTAEVSFTN